MSDYKIFELGDVDLQCGLRLRGARLAYQTYGELNARKDNVIVFPTFFGSQHPANEPMIGPGMALDPARYFIIIPNLFGNGLSSSPSNTPAPYDRARFPGSPTTTTSGSSIGWSPSSSASSGSRWCAGSPWGRSRRSTGGHCIPTWWSGSRRGAARPRRPGITSFSWRASRRPCAPTTPGTTAGTTHRRRKGYGRWRGSMRGGRLRRHSIGRRCTSTSGHSSLEDYLITSWEGRYLQQDANNILAMVATWQAGDISDNPLYGGDFAKALGSIRARAFVMPSRTDQYFPPEDNEIEVSMMPNAEATGHRNHLGTHRRRAGPQPGGHRVHRRATEGTVGELTR